MNKRFFIVPVLFLGLLVKAQQNQLLDQAFWKTGPSVAAVDEAIAKGANPAQLNSNGFDAVTMAINSQAPNQTVLHLLAFKGNEVDKLTHDSRIYLHWAAARGNVELVEALLTRGSDVHKEDSHGFTPLNFAAQGGQKNTVVYDLLLAKGADLKKELNHDGANALLLVVAQDKDFALTNYFVSKGLSLNSTDQLGRTAFDYTARSGNIDQLKALQSKGVNFTQNALLMAAQGGRGSSTKLDVFEYLVGLGINPAARDAGGQNALHSIVRKPNQSDIIAFFLNKGVDINQQDKEGTTAFMNAAAFGTMETLDQLKPKLKDINQANQKGATALCLAVRGNSPEAVKWLIDNGARVQVKDARGDNLAAYLIQSYAPPRAGLPALEAKAKILQDNGFDLATPQQNGNTLYHLAIARDDMALLKFVGNYKVDINAKNKEGMTVLHKAAMTAKSDEILKYLVQNGASKSITTDLKETPYDLASENEYLTKNKISIDFLKM